MDSPDAQIASEERLAALFKKLDTRGVGHLDESDLRRGLARINHPLKDAEQMLRDLLKAVDTSNDGLIQFSEFKVFFAGAEKELYSIFKSVDSDGNGNIDRNELKQALQRAGIMVTPPEKLEQFFRSIDSNRDGVISFEEWRDFLLFMPQEPSLRSIYSYYLSTVNVNSEGDVNVSDEVNLQGLGSLSFFLYQTPQGPTPEVEGTLRLDSPTITKIPLLDVPLVSWLWPGLGYFFAGGVAGALSRTATAPLDRIKVFLIAQTRKSAVDATVKGQAAIAAQQAARPLADAVASIWRNGGIRSFFAGNGLNVIKVLPESAIKFGSFEAAKRTLARLEGVEDVKQMSSVSRFIAGGIGGVVSQFSIYPVDTLKFRMQCEMVDNGSRGNKLITETLMKTWKNGGLNSFYRGLPLALIGIFPYSAIDLGTFELLKGHYAKKEALRTGVAENDVKLPSWMTLVIGGLSGSIGATAVYPLNLLRTRLQAQGTAQHPRTYTGMWDVTMRTLKEEGLRGMYRGWTPNMMKVIPAVSISYLAYEKGKTAMGLK
ncbi:mitochondrial carrier domain-containing protein [Pyronema omphalodes]|nr:mitochondrial carrier domain-containing protein [Pyronema omphalodes]